MSLAGYTECRRRGSSFCSLIFSLPVRISLYLCLAGHHRDRHRDDDDDDDGGDGGDDDDDDDDDRSGRETGRPRPKEGGDGGTAGEARQGGEKKHRGSCVQYLI